MKTPRKLPACINEKGLVLKDFHVSLGDYHWMIISDQLTSINLKIRDESTETMDILNLDIDKSSTMYNAIIEIFTELKSTIPNKETK